MLQKGLFTIAIIIAAFTAQAQFRKIPAVVTDAFKAKYADAAGVEWKDKVTSFEADFTIDRKERKANFTSKGEWIKTETKESFENLPGDVKDGFKKRKYEDLSVADATQIDEKEKGILYKVVVKKNEYSKRNLVFTQTGQLVSDNGTL